MFENLEKAQKHSSVFRECSDYFRCSKILNEYIRELTTELDFASNLFLVFENDFSYGKLTKFFDDNGNNSSLIRHLRKFNYNREVNFSPSELYRSTLEKTVKFLNNLKGWAFCEDDNYACSSVQRAKVFLSYSSLDKPYTFWLYKYFEHNGIFLYVDWMHGKYYFNGSNSKASLISQLNQSEGFLFLQTVNSFNYTASRFSQWCAWEIGVSSSLRKPQFKVDVYGSRPPKSPSIVDGFKKFKSIKDGEMKE